jgi:hypothetical protein
MPALTIEEAFAPLQDPRQAEKVEHRLMDILILALCGLISGAQRYTKIVQMSEERLEFFRTKLGLALLSGIPSHDTFSRVFRMLDTETFAGCLLGWMGAAEIPLEGKQVNIDGKTVRRSHQRSKGIGALHLVSAFVAEHGLVLGQRATPRLLKPYATKVQTIFCRSKPISRRFTQTLSAMLKK